MPTQLLQVDVERKQKRLKIQRQEDQRQREIARMKEDAGIKRVHAEEDDEQEERLRLAEESEQLHQLRVEMIKLGNQVLATAAVAGLDPGTHCEDAETLMED